MNNRIIRTQLFVVVLIVMTVMATVVTVVDAARFRSAYRLALENQALAEARDVRESIHRNLDFFPLEGLPGVTARLQAIVEGDEAIGYAYITDEAGTILYHTRPTRIGGVSDIRLFETVAFRDASDRAVFDRPGAYEVVIPLLQTDDVVGMLHVAVDVRVITPKVLTLVLTHVAMFGGVLVVVGTGLLLFISRFVSRPLARLRLALQQVAAGSFDHTLPVIRDDEIGELTRTYNEMLGRLRTYVADLEQRVVDRTRDLERRSAQLRAATDVGRAITSILDVDHLVNQVVTLIRQRFQMYYVGLFLVEEDGHWAVLRAGAGAEGEELLDEGFRLPVGEGLIGWSIINARARMASDVREDQVRVDVNELPNTRSEVALPLRSRGQVIGALSVQSDEYDAFEEEFLEVLQTLADEVAVAIDNARLFARRQEALESERKAFGELTRRAWQQMLASREEWGYEYEKAELRPATGEWDTAMERAIHAGQRVSDESEARLVIPIRERQEVVGVLSFEKEEVGAVWSDEEIALLETLAERLGVALESARSYQETQKRAAREQLIGAVTSRIRESLDIDQVMQTAVNQIREAFGLHDAVIELGPVDAVSDLEQ